MPESRPLSRGMSAICPCGHGVEVHDAGGICFAKLPTFPHGGFHGVCPCTPAWLEAQTQESGDE